MSEGFEPLPFLEAIAWAKARQVVLPAVYYGELQGLARAQAFTVSGLAVLDQIQGIADSLTAALETGETFGAWQAQVIEDLQLIDLSPARMETIFRNNIQQSYNRGRYEQQARVVDDFPWYLYDAVNDSRTRLAHAAMDGMVARHDDPIWERWTPACGHRCRCKRVALTERQAARMIAEDQARLEREPERAGDRAKAQPDPGWGINIYRDPNAGLRRAEAAKLAGANPKLREAYESARATAEQVAAQQREAMAKRQRQAAIRRAIKPEQDDLLAAIAKAGGLDSREAVAQGIDPADLSRRGHQIFRVFTQRGDSFDGMAERLAQHGYPVLDADGRYSPNALLSVLDNALRGKPVISSRNTGLADELYQRYLANQAGADAFYDAAEAVAGAAQEKLEMAAVLRDGNAWLGNEQVGYLLERADSAYGDLPDDLFLRRLSEMVEDAIAEVLNSYRGIL